MRAALVGAYGPVDTVAVTDLDAPVLGEGEARVAVHAASVNFPDVLIAAGEYQIKALPPFVLGSEFSGVVTELAAGVTSIAVGDRVNGSVFVGAFATECAANAAVLSKVPESIDFAAAAAFGVAHRTAWHVLRSVAHLQSKEDLIVLGAGGGVGLAAVQLGALLGARVTAVASSNEKLRVAQRFGATYLVNHRDVDLRVALKEFGGADVVVDPVGGDLAEPALRALRYGGRFVTVGYASGAIPKIPLNLVLLKGVTIAGFQFGAFAQHRGEEMVANEAELLAHFAAGRAFAHVSARFALDDVVSALRHVADGNAIGKVILDIA